MLNVADIKVLILQRDKDRISLDDIYVILSNNDRLILNKLKTVEYNTFYNMVQNLINEGILIKCGRNTNKKANELHLKYSVIRPDNKVRLDKQNILFITSLNNKINTEYYRNHPDEFIHDKKYIKIFNDLLNKICTQGSIEHISINERSYELFKDEKFIKGGTNIPPEGANILKRLRLLIQILVAIKIINQC